MRVMINEPDGRMSGLVVGETFDLFYSDYFSLNKLNGKTGEETVSLIKESIEKIQARANSEEEQSIASKIIKMLNNLLELAQKNPKGVWKVSAV